jgi:hypothetical protein
VERFYLLAAVVAADAGRRPDAGAKEIRGLAFLLPRPREMPH